jgi:hypothetical protein
MAKHFSPDGEELRPYSIRQPSHPLLPDMIPSEVEPHITALEAANIYDDLTPVQQATIIRLMQAAYRNGQAHQGAEKVDGDAVWVDGVGMIERRPDGSWQVTGYDAAKDAEMIRAREIDLGIGYTPQQYDAWAKSYYARKLGSLGGSSTSETKQTASRINGKKGGRPPKAKTE